MISPNSIDQLLHVAHIEDVVGDYVNLKRSGSRYKGNCPFHDEKTPSFVVTPSLGIYKCFGCQKGGNAIHFVMDIENLTFTEAARNLAKRYNLELVETSSENKDEAIEAQKEKEAIRGINEFALKFFTEQLQLSDEGKTIAGPYFRERGYTPDTIQQWKLGFSPSSWDAFYQAARAAGFKDELMLQAGLVKQRDKDGSFYDLYRNRVIFPLIAVNNAIVGFAGRVMGKVDNAPKYVNSPETVLYKKSDFLFALNQAKNTIRKEDKAYLMEGYTDVITLHQSGITNAVASSGTALTPGQIRLIKRFTDNATVIYDGDAAGMKASLRGINLLLEEGLNVRVVPMPEGEDPDSYCKKLGPEKFKEYLNSAEQNFIFFKAELLLQGTENDPIRKSEAISDIIESVALIQDRLKRDVLMTNLEPICNVKIDNLYAELTKQLRKQATKEHREMLTEVDLLLKNAGVDSANTVYSEQKTSVPTQFNVGSGGKLSDVHQEIALLRLIFLYGGEMFDDNLKLIDFIISEYRADEASIAFKDEKSQFLIQHILELYDQQLEWPTKEYFIQHPDNRISGFAASVFSADYQLSSAFEGNLIYVKQESENFRQEAVDIFLNLRRTKIEELIIATQKMLLDPEANHEEIMEYLDYLNTIKKEIASKLGNVVTRI